MGELVPDVAPPVEAPEGAPDGAGAEPPDDEAVSEVAEALSDDFAAADSAPDEPPSVVAAALSPSPSLDADPDADADLPAVLRLLSWTYQPLPLKTMPAAEMRRRAFCAPQTGHSRMGSSANRWTRSNSALQASHVYS
ncbi:MAG: hypothetical protein ABI780_12520 [Ardenticatenales bacterium]